ncbi:MAG: response regulator [Anaerolineae bacterium]|nr:response regulator [Anaerolineae bacterium]
MNIPNDLLIDWVIVVVDDEEDSLMVAEIILNAYGAVLYTARNGSEALELIRRARPHFVISDLSMPILDGWGLIHEMKRDLAVADIPVIALTAHAMSGDRERAMAAGFHNYLTKPLTVETFIQDLVNLLVDIPELAAELNI